MQSRKFSKQRRIAWYGASISFSAFFVWFLTQNEYLKDPDTVKPAIVVFFLVWVVIMVLIRLFFRDLKDWTKSGD